MNVREQLRARATELGFHAVGFAEAVALVEEQERLEGWLRAERHATMSYLERWPEVRRDPSHPGMVEGARTIISLAVQIPAPRELPPDALLGHISLYARGEDYHQRLRKMMKVLLRELKVLLPRERGRVLVDSAPILERAWAVRAGLGWIGKNTCLIHPELGSNLVLGEVVTTAELEPDVPNDEDRCGRCRECVEACPGGALSKPEGRELDARRCLSHWTIEAAEEELPDPLRASETFFGCDTCQNVCPWNEDVPQLDSPLTPLSRWDGLTLEIFAAMKLEEISVLIKGTPLERAGAEALRGRARRLVVD